MEIYNKALLFFMKFENIYPQAGDMLVLKLELEQAKKIYDKINIAGKKE